MLCGCAGEVGAANARWSARLSDEQAARPRLIRIYPFGYVRRVNAINVLRHLAGLTQQELAARAGTAQPTIAAYEASRKSPTLRTLEKLARAAGAILSTDEVLCARP
jgi:DNA-binding XRE family transcriptional regulator